MPSNQVTSHSPKHVIRKNNIAMADEEEQEIIPQNDEKEEKTNHSKDLQTTMSEGRLPSASRKGIRNCLPNQRRQSLAAKEELRKARGIWIGFISDDEYDRPPAPPAEMAEGDVGVDDYEESDDEDEENNGSNYPAEDEADSASDGPQPASEEQDNPDDSGRGSDDEREDEAICAKSENDSAADETEENSPIGSPVIESEGVATASGSEKQRSEPEIYLTREPEMESSSHMLGHSAGTPDQHEDVEDVGTEKEDEVNEEAETGDQTEQEDESGENEKENVENFLDQDNLQSDDAELDIVAHENEPSTSSKKWTETVDGDKEDSEDEARKDQMDEPNGESQGTPKSNRRINLQNSPEATSRKGTGVTSRTLCRKSSKNTQWDPSYSRRERHRHHSKSNRDHGLNHWKKPHGRLPPIRYKSRAYVDHDKRRIYVDVKAPSLKDVAVSTRDSENIGTYQIEMRLSFEMDRRDRTVPAWRKPNQLPPLRRTHPKDKEAPRDTPGNRTDPDRVNQRAQYPPFKFGPSNL